LGPSAASHIGNARWTNVSDLDEWAAALDAGRDPRAEAVTLAPDVEAKEALISGLRLVQGVDLRQLGARLGLDLWAMFAPEIEDLVEKGLLIRRKDQLHIPEERLLVSNAILSRFV
jgi:oxygen-independent coproporphyrinogen-3 oxidase